MVLALAVYWVRLNAEIPVLDIGEDDYRRNPFVSAHRSPSGHWKVTTTYRTRDGAVDRVKVERHGRILFSKKVDSGGIVKAKMCEFAVGFPVLAILEHSWCGHGQTTWFYGYLNRRFHFLGETEGEHGGPVFRDIDHDGTLEWIIDNYDHYRYPDSRPTHFFIYRLKDKRLTLWKSVPNKQRKRLPNSIGANMF